MVSKVKKLNYCISPWWWGKINVAIDWWPLPTCLPNKIARQSKPIFGVIDDRILMMNMQTWVEPDNQLVWMKPEQGCEKPNI